MRVLLDENLPRRLRMHLASSIEALTVQDCGWSGNRNSALLSLAEGEFDVLITMDRGFEFKQNIQHMSIGVLIIRAPSNRFEHIEPLIPELNEALKEIRPGRVVHVGS